MLYTPLSPYTAVDASPVTAIASAAPKNPHTNI